MQMSLKDGDYCEVVRGTHAGKSGAVRDIKTSKTGHVTITVVQKSGVRFKTLAANARACGPRAERQVAGGRTRKPSRRIVRPQRLSGGNPQVAKADGDVPVQTYIAAMPGWKHGVGRRLDALISKCVPGAHKGVRWNSPMYGVRGQGWFVAFHVFTNYVKVTFFRGTSLQPSPPGGSGKEARWIDIHKDDLDEAQLIHWVQQAAAIPGWGKS